MNREQIKEMLPILQAFADGKCVQVKGIGGHWEDRSELALNMTPREYRIKPEPRELWVNVFPNGYEAYHKTKSDADRDARSGRIECIHLVEQP